MKTLQKKLLLFLLILPIGIFAQSTLKGVVLDGSSKQPLPSVNIIVEGTTTGTTTDFDGNFTLSNVKNGDKIVFSYVGFQDQTITFSGQKEITVTLQEDAQQFKDVVVIGYGSVKKKDATGSLTSITSKDFNKGAIISADQLLTGKAPGVRITSNGGQPDSDPNIRIRGGASINANNSPLIVIDGIPIDNTNPAGVSNPLSMINPNDIESFTILKDASAAAIYGSRASNGVIIITTKKGTSGAPEFNYSANVSLGRVGKKIDMMNGKEFTRFIQEYHPNSIDNYTNGIKGLSDLLGIDDPNSTAIDNPATPEVEGRILSDTDWQDEILRNSVSTDHNFSARANLYGKTPFRASIGFNNSQGLVKTSDYERLNFSFKVTPKYLNNNLKVDFNAKGSYSVKNAIDEGGSLGGAIAMDPTKPVYDNSPTNRFGGYYQNTIIQTNPVTNYQTLNIDGQYNPLAVLEQRSRPERALRFLSNIEFDYKMPFLPELRAVVNLGIDASRAKIRESYSNNSLATYKFNTLNTDINTNYLFNPGKNYAEFQHKTNSTFDAYLVYAKELKGAIKRFDVQGGYSYQNFKNDGNSESFRYNIVSGVREPNINVNNPNNRYYNNLNLQSFFGRANVDILNKYLFTFSLRADGSSLFREDKRWGYFPAAAVAWKLKEESFLADSKLINDLKLRLSWGKTGQQDITGLVGFYPSSPLFDIAGATSQYLQGVNLYSARAFNPDLTWEKSATYNAGLDFDVFKNGLVNGSFDVFYKETTDLLAEVDLPPGQGLSNRFIKNVASTESKGFELNLNFKPYKTDNSELNINTNLSYNRTEITDLDGQESISAGGSLPTGTGVNLMRHPLNHQPYSAWVFEQLYNQNGEPIVGAFVDRNGDNVIDNDDRYYKAVRPNWTFGFGLNYNYKNWDLSTAFRGQFGGQVYNARKLTSGWIDRAKPVNTNSLSNVLDFYSGAADIDFQTVNGNIALSDYFLEDATFLRCENIIVGYRFNKFYKSASMRVYGGVNNAFIVTKYDGQDPENFNSIDNNFYPRPRVYTFGLSLDF
jgi:TonB-linked SusC/RagA family outer membrane protein